MKPYTITLEFTNLDNCLYTDHQVTMQFQIQSDTVDHAYLMAQRLQDLYGADNFFVGII